jgi:hypothetical protein
MEHNKVLVRIAFLQIFIYFLESCKARLNESFHEFHAGRLPIHNLNYGIITLLSKIADAARIQQYRPICLLNVSFKIFTKVLNNRILKVADKLIGPSQMAFIPGHYIMEGVVMLPEMIHELHRKRQDGVILKLDFEKTYDKLKWPFIQQVLRMKGFSLTWCEWISMVMSRGSVAVKVNDNVGHYFQTRKGVRQGDPLSPILFNIMVDMLAILISRAKEAEHI